MNQFTNMIIKTLKKTPFDDQNTIWETYCNDQRIKDDYFDKEKYLPTLDVVFQIEIKKIKRKGTGKGKGIINITRLWESGDLCDEKFMSMPLGQEYQATEEEMLTDILNETIDLMCCDVQQLH